MNWQIKPDMLGRGYFISFLATYLAYHDASVDIAANDSHSCFWPTYDSALTFLRRFRDAITENCLAHPRGPDRRLIGM